VFRLAAYGAARVAAVILARNEERTIGRAIDGATGRAHEVVVLDGGSTDRTVEVARAAGARVLRDPGRGKGSAIRMAIDQLDADVLVFMDADGSHEPDDIPKLAMPVVRGEADLCVGSRFAGGSDELSATFPQLIRTLGNIGLNVVINLRWKSSLTDTLNGFRAVRRRAAASVGLREDRHTIEQEVVMKMLRHGYRVVNVPSHEFARQYGTSHIDIWREWPRFVFCVFRNLVHRRPPARFEPVPCEYLDREVCDSPR
jgi:dolichol-phosphate mannosyltransferase